jgi:hypothetical protein
MIKFVAGAPGKTLGWQTRMKPADDGETSLIEHGPFAATNRR